LTLLVARVLANYSYHATAPNDFAFFTTFSH
jgi:hypothetical protein